MRSSAARPVTPASLRSERRRIRRTECLRLSAESGFWKTIWSARSSFRERFWYRSGSSVPSSDRRAGGRRNDSEQRPRKCRLPAAGLPDETERLAGPDRGGDVRERVDVVTTLREDLREAVKLDERRLRPVDRWELEVGCLLARKIARAVVIPAPALVTGGDGEERRLLRVTALVRERAAIGEDTPWELDTERGQEARDRVEATVVLAHASARDAAQEADRVGVARVLEHCLHGAFLDETTGIEHPDPRAHLRDHAEVVADEKHRRVQPGLELRDEIQHLGLYGGVEPGGGLVEDKQLGVLRERHGDHHALLHAAGELVRVPAHDAGGVRDLHRHKGLARSLGRLLARHS